MTTTQRLRGLISFYSSFYKVYSVIEIFY